MEKSLFFAGFGSLEVLLLQIFTLVVGFFAFHEGDCHFAEASFVDEDFQRDDGHAQFLGFGAQAADLVFMQEQFSFAGGIGGEVSGFFEG